MLATGDPLQAFAPGGDAALLAGIALVKRKLEFTSLQRLTHGNAQPATHIEADPRPGAGEIGQKLRQPVGGKVLRNAEANDAVAGWAR